MQRLFLLIAVVAAAAGALWYFDIVRVEGLENLAINPGANGTKADVADSSGAATSRRGSGTIRVATYDVEIMGDEKIDQPGLRDNLAKIIRQFDVVALQEIASRNPNVLPRLVDAVNSAGGRYDFVIGPRLGRTEHTEQYAVVYNTATVEVDLESVYTVSDPDDLIHRAPLVVAFRTRGAEAKKAFTFTLVNVRVDQYDVDGELPVLEEIVTAVRQDGRGEDDVILLGDMQADVDHLCRWWDDTDKVFCLAEPTDAYGRRTIHDNIVLRRQATSEFTGRSGAYDPVQELGIPFESAAQLSSHVPVWAEFDITEGGRPHRVASSAEGETPAR
ncbi:MAG: hypothetical protein KDA63_17980 [Planctomycetales bacterium]|nr:hypothetical protein [Planctomycetales bacterium]